MSETYLKDLIDPEVLTDMVDAKIPHAIRFSSVAVIDNTLVGQPGSSITVPKWGRISDAVVIPEGESFPKNALGTSTESFTVQKVGNSVPLTDEAVLSAYGNPVGTAVTQIAETLASAVDTSILEAARKAPLSLTAAIDKELFDKVDTTFNFEDLVSGILFCNNATAVKLRNTFSLEYERQSQAGDNVVVQGSFATIFGWSIVISNRLEDDEMIFVVDKPFTVFSKRNVVLETYREVLRRVTHVTADLHFVAGLTLEDKVLRVNSGGASGE